MTRTAPRSTRSGTPTGAGIRPERSLTGRAGGLGTGIVFALGLLLAGCGSATTNGPSSSTAGASSSTAGPAGTAGTGSSSAPAVPSGVVTTPTSAAPTGASSGAVPAPTGGPAPALTPTPSSPRGTGGSAELSPTVPASPAPGAGPAPTVQIGQTLAGTIEPGVESGCVVLTANGAVVANLVGKPAAELLAQGGDGQVRVRGDFLAGGVSFCQQGRMFQVSEILPG